MIKQDRVFITPHNNYKKNIDEMKIYATALDGKIFASLTPLELEVCKFFNMLGKKFDVSIHVELDGVDLINDELCFFKDSESYQKIFNTNATVRVTLN